MILSPTTYSQLEDNFVTWAKTQPDIRSAIVIGSRARPDPPADQWSDLDIILYATDPASYAANPNWLSELGTVWIPHLNYTFAHEAEWIILFAGGLKVDFVLSTARGTLQQMVSQSPYQIVFRRGVRPLFDKNEKDAPKDVSEIKLTLPEVGPTSRSLPTQAEFLATINHALLSAVRAGKFLKRGERWQAKFQCDTDLKRHLLSMLEWYACVTSTPSPDTWYEGRFLDQWIVSPVLEAIPHTFATYDTTDLWRALFATLDLFRQLAIEIALHLGYTYLTQTDKQVTEWLKSLR